MTVTITVRDPGNPCREALMLVADTDGSRVPHITSQPVRCQPACPQPACSIGPTVPASESGLCEFAVRRMNQRDRAVAAGYYPAVSSRC